MLLEGSPTELASALTPHSLICSNGRQRSARVLQDYKSLPSRCFPGHPPLNKRQSVLWRLLKRIRIKTGLRIATPIQGTVVTNVTTAKANGLARREATSGRRIPQVEQWETVLLNFDRVDYIWAIQLVEDAAKAQGILADAYRITSFPNKALSLSSEICLW